MSNPYIVVSASARPEADEPSFPSNPLTVGTSAVTHVGDLVYCLDDNILDLTSSSNLKAMGRIIRWRTGTKCDVYVFSPQESAAS